MTQVYLVGAGPGDPALISYKGMQALRQADVVFYDRLLNPLLLYLTTEETELIYVGKTPQQHAMTQREIEREMIRYARLGKTVVRLKGGDPAIFGRVGEEMQALAAAKIPYQVIPGISSVSAVSVYGGFSVTQRQIAEKVLICTPTAVLDDFAKEPLAQIAAGGSVVIYMGMEQLAAIVGIFLQQGSPAETPIAVVQWGTWGRQQKVVGTLATISQQVTAKGLTNPALIVVGPAVAAAKGDSWFETLPRFGQALIYVSREPLSFEEMLTYTEEGYDFYPVFVGSAFQKRFQKIHQRLLPQYLQRAQVRFAEADLALDWQQFQKNVLEENQ